MKADLHTHSTVSDGCAVIGELIGMAKRKGLDAIAITDHDTLSHVAQLPDDAGIRVVGGIEISSVDRATNTRAHVLGYNIRNPAVVTALTQPMLEEGNRNSLKQAEVLIRHGYRIDMDRLAKADGTYLYKQHIMDWLVATGQAPDMFGDFYYKIFKNGGICDFDIAYVDAFDAVETIKAAGGLAVLAHPGQQKNFWLIPRLAQSGLDGVELNHHSHSEEDKETLRDCAKRYGLFLTGGSDYHGRYEPQPFGVGDFLSDESGARAICRE